MKSHRFTKLPPILNVSFLRFLNDGRKITKYVDFPVDNFIVYKNNEEVKYVLISVVNHIGDGIVGGHCKYLLLKHFFDFKIKSI